MCESMVDIQSTTDENRREKKKQEEETIRRKYNGLSYWVAIKSPVISLLSSDQC